MRISRLIVLPVLMALIGCSSEKPSEENQTESEARISAKEVIEANDVEVGSLEKMALTTTIHTTGRIAAPPQSMVSVYPVVGGFVKKVHVISGEEVRKGQTLFTLAHPDIVKKQQEYLEARADFLSADADWKRKQDLIKDQSVSQKAYQQSESDYLRAKSRLSSLEMALRDMGLNPESVNTGGLAGNIRITADIDGVVTEVLIHTGEYVSGDTRLAEILDKTNLQLELQVRPQEIDQVQTGQLVKFWKGDKQMKGKVYLVNPQVGSNNFSMVNVHFDESQGDWKPGTFVNAEIILSADTVFGLPITAVYREGGRSYAVAVSGDELIPVEVQTGDQNDSHIEIKNPQDLQGKKLALNKVKYLMGSAAEE